MSYLVQYIIVRTDLLTSFSWPVGALIAQACHATAAVSHIYSEDENMVNYLKDFKNMHKVVLGIDTETKLVNLSEKLKSSHIDHEMWIEKPENFPTCLVTKPYPKDIVQKYFKKLKLFRHEPLAERVDNSSQTSLKSDIS